MKVDKLKINLIMADRMLSSKQIADRGNISLPTFHRAMKGLDVSPRTVGRLARGLGVEAREITKGV